MTEPVPAPVPDHAITPEMVHAAAEAMGDPELLRRIVGRMGEASKSRRLTMALAALEAAAPLIREAERQRLALDEHARLSQHIELTQEELTAMKAKWLAAWEAARGQPAVVLDDEPDPFEPVAKLVEEAVEAERQRIRHDLLDGDPGKLEQAFREFVDPEEAADCALAVADLLADGHG